MLPMHIPDFQGDGGVHKLSDLFTAAGVVLPGNKGEVGPRGRDYGRRIQHAHRRCFRVRHQRPAPEHQREPVYAAPGGIRRRCALRSRQNLSASAHGRYHRHRRGRVDALKASVNDGSFSHGKSAAEACGPVATVAETVAGVPQKTGYFTVFGRTAIPGIIPVTSLFC